ncbi:annexin A2 [Aplochiton taeniatus]
MDSEYLQSCEMCWGTLGTVRPFPNFKAEKDAEEIKTALEKKDTITLVRILTNRSNAQRQAVSQAYQSLTKKDLVSGTKKAVSGELGNLLLALLMTPLQFEAYRFRQAMEGIGTDEETLMELLCTQSTQQLNQISDAYKELYKRDLEKDLKGETSGDFLKLIVALLKREESVGSVLKDIEALSESIHKKLDAATWISILTSRDSVHLNKVLSGLEMEKKQSVDEALETWFKGDICMGLRTLVRCIQNPYLYLAQRLQTMKASIVQGVMVSHCEEDLLFVRAAYLRQTGTSLYTALQTPFKGEHLQALLAICRAED